MDISDFVNITPQPIIYHFEATDNHEKRRLKENILSTKFQFFLLASDHKASHFHYIQRKNRFNITKSLSTFEDHHQGPEYADSIPVQRTKKGPPIYCAYAYLFFYFQANQISLLFKFLFYVYIFFNLMQTNLYLF